MALARLRRPITPRPLFRASVACASRARFRSASLTRQEDGGGRRSRLAFTPSVTARPLPCFILALCLGVGLSAHASTPAPPDPPATCRPPSRPGAPASGPEAARVETLLAGLSLEARVGQLMMVGFYGTGGGRGGGGAGARPPGGWASASSSTTSATPGRWRASMTGCGGCWMGWPRPSLPRAGSGGGQRGAGAGSGGGAAQQHGAGRHPLAGAGLRSGSRAGGGPETVWAST